MSTVNVELPPFRPNFNTCQSKEWIAVNLIKGLYLYTRTMTLLEFYAGVGEALHR